MDLSSAYEYTSLWYTVVMCDVTFWFFTTWYFRFFVTTRNLIFLSSCDPSPLHNKKLIEFLANKNIYKTKIKILGFRETENLISMYILMTFVVFSYSWNVTIRSWKHFLKITTFTHTPPTLTPPHPTHTHTNIMKKTKSLIQVLGVNFLATMYQTKTNILYKNKNIIYTWGYLPL